MSISTDSTNSGDFSSDDYDNEKRGNEINYDELRSIFNEEAVVKTNGEQFSDSQQLKEHSEKFEKMELVLKITKLELKNKGLQEKLKQQKTNALLAKIEAENGKMKNEIEKMQAKMDEKEKQYTDKLEQLQKKQKALQEDHEKKLMEQIVNLQAKVDKLEMENQQQKVSIDQIEHLQNEQKRKDNAFEKEQKKIRMKMALLNSRQNYWDGYTCHNELEITGLKIHCHISAESADFRTAFAFHPILFDENFYSFFYFEISVKNAPKYLHSQKITFGFAPTKWTKLEGTIVANFGTYAYSNNGSFTIDGKWMDQKLDAFQANDIVGCGINSATRQIFFTKNGWRQGSFYTVDSLPSYVPDELFPFVSLLTIGNEIEANFGPHFKFNLAKL
ncbi:hypothetical protein niasHT_015098 [Heterodera trifolii]|uniref:B30.2/SPRY domain-containing protein n=1 Tax=Heterodera trifolii TaxID=157864 RepID=A0ABD2L9I4_9BILA